MWFIPLTSVSRISILTINKIEQNVKGLLFNSLRELQTKPLPPIRHICDFSRCVLNVRLPACIQHLLRDHKYALLRAMASVLWLEKVN